MYTVHVQCRVVAIPICVVEHKIIVNNGKRTKHSANDWGSRGNAPKGIQRLTRSFSIHIVQLLILVFFFFLPGRNREWWASAHHTCSYNPGTVYMQIASIIGSYKFIGGRGRGIGVHVCTCTCTCKCPQQKGNDLIRHLGRLMQDSHGNAAFRDCLDSLFVAQLPRK